MRKLKVPAALGVATLGTATTIALAASCGGGDPPKDASTSCAVYCVGGFIDGGPPEPDGGCPTCATEDNGVFTCPTGCTPLG